MAVKWLNFNKLSILQEKRENNYRIIAELLQSNLQFILQ